VSSLFVITPCGPAYNFREGIFIGVVDYKSQVSIAIDLSCLMLQLL
jgi:hypothetical protein